MALAARGKWPESVLANELRDCHEKLDNLSESLKNERKLSEIKEKTIQNLKREIRIVDKDASEKKREIEKLNEIVQPLRSKAMTLETENKVLENQAKVVQDSNHRLYKELLETRRTQRQRDTEAEETKVQQYDATRKYAHLLRATIDKYTRFNCFLQELESDFHSRDVCLKRLQAQRMTVEGALKEQNLENKRYPEHGWYGLFPLRRHSHVLLEDEKENLKKDLEKVCSDNTSLSDDSVMNKLVQSVETAMVDCLKSRISVQDHAITEAQKKLRGARAEVRELKNLDHEQVESAKRMEGKVSTLKQLLGEKLKELNRELSAAQTSQREEEGNMSPTRKFSVGCDSRIRSLSLVEKTSREEILEIKKSISSLVSKTEVTNNPLSDMEERILSVNQKLTRLIEEKIALSDELIDSQNSLINLEALLGSQMQENSALNKELSGKQKVLRETEKNMRAALQGKTELERRLNTSNQELQKRRKEAESYKVKLAERAHRVELNFTPRSQSTKELTPETPRQHAISEPITSTEQLPQKDVAHKYVQVDGNAQHSVLSARKSSDRRRNPVEFPRERRLSKAELKLTFKYNKETQVDNSTQDMLRVEAALKEARSENEAIEKLNQELQSRLETREKEIERLTSQMEELQNRDLGEKNRKTGLCRSFVELQLQGNGEEEERITRKVQTESHKHQDGRRETETDILQDCRKDILDLQESLGNAPMDSEVLRNQKDELIKELKRKENEIKRLTEKENASEWTEPEVTFFAKQEKVSTIITQMEDKILLEAEKDNEFFGQKFSDQQDIIFKMRKKTEYLEKRNKEVEKELEEQRKLVSSLRVQRVDLQGRVSSQDETSLDDRSIFKEEILELQHSVKNTILQKEDVENKLQDLRDELQRRASTLEAHENEWYKAQTSHLKKKIEETLEEKDAIEKEIEDLQTELHSRRISRITAEVNEYERKNSLSYPEGANTPKMLNDLKEAIEKAQERELKAKMRVRELERVLADKRELINAYLSEEKIVPPQDSQLNYLFGGDSKGMGNDNDRKLRYEFTLLNLEIGTLRRRVEIREKNLETKVKELAQKEFLIQKVIREKNREMEEMEIKFKCRLQEQLEKLHKELTAGKDFFNEAAKEEKLSLKEKLTKLHAHVKSNETMMERERGLSQQKCKRLENAVDALERQNLDLKDESNDFQAQTVEVNSQLKKSEERIYQFAERLSLAEKRCAHLDTTLERSQCSESELKAKLQRLAEENAELESKIEKAAEAESELAESKKKCIALEGSILNVREELSALEEQAIVLQHQSTCLKKEKLSKDEEMSHLEKKLDDALTERDSTISDKDAAANLLQRKVDETEKMALDTKRAQQQEQEKLREVRNKLQEVEVKYAVVKEENHRLEKELKSSTEKMFQLQKNLSDSQAEVKTQAERLKSLNVQNSRLKDVSNEKDEILRREERLRMENMKTLDALKIKLEKTESGDKRQRERLFSLKSACSEANEAYEIVKKQNMELWSDMKELKKKLDEQDAALESSQKEKETLEEHILNASRSIGELKRFSRCERVSPDSALGISIASYTSDLSSGPNSPNSEFRDDMSDSAFLIEAADEKYGMEQDDLLCKMPNIIENFRAVVLENETIRNRLGALLIGKEKTDSQILEYSKVNTSLNKDVEQKEKRLTALESKIKLLDDDLLDADSKVGDMEQCLTASTSELEITQRRLIDREAAIEDLKEKMDLLEEREKAMELYSKSVSEKFKYEESEKKKVEDINSQLQGQVEEHKNRIGAIESKLSQPKREDIGLLAISYPDGVSMETAESKLDAFLVQLGELETSLSAIQSEGIGLRRENEDLEYANEELRKYESLSRELEKQIRDLQVRDEVANDRITQLENQVEMLDSQNNDNEQAIQEYKTNDDELQEKVKLTEYSIRALERANETYRDETERLRESLRQADETCSKQDTELNSAMMKLSALEITNETYRAENEKLQQDLKALSEAKCEVEYKISEAERQKRKLNEMIDHEKTQNAEAEKKRQEIQEYCEGLYQEKTKFKESVTAWEEKLERAQHDRDQLEKEALKLSSENSKLTDQLSLVTKNFSELEEKLKNATVQREKLEQQLSIASLEASKLNSAYETSVRRKNATEKSLVGANGKNEELQVCLEQAREEKASLLKEDSHKEQQIQQLEIQRDELKDDKQKLVNDVYFGTRKVLALHQELETLRGDANLLGKELRGIMQGSLGKERFSEESDARDGDDKSDRSYETPPQALRQSIRATERVLEAIRPEARITDLESKSCQREVDGIRKEFSHLKEQLCTYKQQSKKLAEEVKRTRDELAAKQSHLLESKECHDTLKEENLETREAVSQLQNKVAELEVLLTEYENKAETSHAKLVRANQQIATLEANLTRSDQKKITQEKELLVANEKISHLEANARAMKDDGRNDKRKIASLEVEYSEKQALARELEKTDSALTDLRFKYGDLLKEKEEVKTELASLREESRQEQLELKSTRKEAESLKRTMSTEKDLRAKAEQDLTRKTEQCEAYKKNLQKMERSLGKLQSDNACLEEKVKLLEDAGTTLNRETETQIVEMKRLVDALQDMKNNLKKVSDNYEGCEKGRKRLTEELIKAEEKVSKLQGTCDELLKEKKGSSLKLTSLNEALELAICNREEIETSLKQDLMLIKKELSVTSSSLERSQKKVDDLLQETQNNELKIKALEEKKQDALDKYWAGLEELTAAEANIDNLRTEGSELKAKCAADILKIQMLQETLDEEREENEREIASWNEKMNKLKILHQMVTEERDYLKEDLEDTRSSLAKVNEELQQASSTLNKTERCFRDEVSSRDEVIEDLASQTMNMKEELTNTKSVLKETTLDNADLRERINITADKVERLEKTLDERNNEIEDLLAEAHAKLNVVKQMKVANSGESFAEFPTISVVEDETDGLGHANATRSNAQKKTIKEVVTSYHRACLSSLNECRSLQEKLSQANQDRERLKDNLQKERAETAEIKKYLQEVQKKRTRSEEDVKRLRRRLESFKAKSIEVEKERDNEITEVKGDKVALERDLWEAKESLEQVKARLRSTDEEKNRYAKDLESSRKAVVDAKNEVRSAQGQLDFLQENMLQLKKRIFELEATEKFSKQQLQEKEKELHVTQLKIQELEKLNDDSNKKKTELYQGVAKAEEKIGCLESDCHNKTGQNAALESKITQMKSSINELEKTLEKVRSDLKASRKECDDLEIHRANLHVGNDALKQQVEISRSESNALHRSLGKTQEENEGLKKELAQTRGAKENLENENTALLKEKQAAKKDIHSSDTSLREAEDKLVKSFQENESLKRQHIKTQSSACADLAQKQLEMGKLKAEACSLKQELIEKNKALNDVLTKSKVVEKENEFLKKEVGDIHHQKSDLRLDLNATTSKLQSYVMERECWEREVKNVLTEIDKQENANQSKEQRLERMRTRYEQEVKFLQQRVEGLEREMRVLHEGYEQQRHADEIAYKLAMESKDMEIDNLKLRLQTTRLHANDKSNVLDVMKGQLDQRSAKIQELTDQIHCLKESYQLEVASLQADLKGAHAENLLHTRGDTSYDNSASDNVGELLDEIQSSRKESDRLRRMLGSKMTEMKSLNNHVTSERTSGSRNGGHLVPYSYSKSPRRAGLMSME